jgi:transposase
MNTQKDMKVLEGGNQRSLFGASTSKSDGVNPSMPKEIPDFVNPTPDNIYLGETSLKEHLTNTGFSWVIGLRKFLGNLDWSGFEVKYNPSGRRPIHPQVILGLIIYGIMEGKWSLRDLERLACRDVCAWHLCGGQMPDHSTIGNFITRHEDILTDDFFTKTLKEITKAIKINLNEAAGDGTTIQSMASRYKMLSEEAAREAAKKAREKANKNSDDEKLEAKAVKLEELSKEIKLRADARRDKGKKADSIRISPTDPDAMYQPMKNKVRRTSYKPVILADRQRFILGQTVEPSSENIGMKKLLEQHEDTTGRPLERTLLDSGFNCSEILALGLEKEIDLLIPSGQTLDDDWTRKAGEGKKYLKQAFKYNEAKDVYVCPGGKELKFSDQYKEKDGKIIRRYRCSECAGCALKSKCTASKAGRSIKRYEHDELKEAMEQVMSQEGARKAYVKRQWMVEPVFGVLRDNQGLRRFHRKGIKKVRLEFALHAVAYNIGRAVKVFGMCRIGIPDPSTSKKAYIYVFFAFENNL